MTFKLPHVTVALLVVAAIAYFAGTKFGAFWQSNG